MEGKTERREKLECPLVPPLEQKLANMTRSRPIIGPAPRSAVLDKLASFLPQMAHENARLQQLMQDRPAAEFDIEYVEEEEGPYIEMDLACGILELRDEAALRAAERAMEGQGGSLHSSGASSTSSSSDDSDEDSDENDVDGEDDEEGRYRDDDGELRESNAQRLDPTEEEAGGGDGAGQDGQASRRRAGRASLANGRRKVATKRSTLIEELS